jgi:hypothetical protein
LKNGPEDTITKDETPKNIIMDMFKRCTGSSHKVLNEGINRTFISENSLFQYQEERDGYWGLDFDGAHSILGSCIRVILIKRIPFSHTNLSSTAPST